MALTESLLKNLKPKERRYKKADGEGLFIVVMPNGSKLWHFYYSFGGRKTLSIGKYPNVSLLEAREQRHEAQLLLAENKDPSQQKQQAKVIAEFGVADTFKKVSMEWVAEASETREWTSRYKRKIENSLKNHIFRKLGNRPVFDITPMEALLVLKEVQVSGRLDTAHRVRRSMMEIFEHAMITRGVFDKRNPAEGLEKKLKRYRGENYPRITEEEIPEFLRALQK